MVLVNQLLDVLRKAATTFEIDSYELYVNMNVNLGDGILADVYNASITNKNNNQEIKLIIKTAPSGQDHRVLCMIEILFKNEIHFYSNILPLMESLGKNESSVTPRYVVSESLSPKEMIVLHDLLHEEYEIKNRAESLDQMHVREVFKAYGHFHATSMCLKEQNRKNFENLMNSFIDVWKIVVGQSAFVKAYKTLISTSINEALGQYPDLKSKLQSYIGKFPENLLDSMNYKGEYGTLLHGDCWANSAMFKYSNKEKTDIESVKLVDFQVPRYGSPVHDLSYFLFIGAADLKENFDNWESLLDAYYEAFSARAREFNKDPETLLPRKVLSADWKRYAKSSMLLSMMLLKMKYASDAEIKKQSEILKKNPKSLPNDRLVRLEYDQELFNKRFLNIVEHLNKIGAL